MTAMHRLQRKNGSAHDADFDDYDSGVVSFIG